VLFLLLIFFFFAFPLAASAEEYAEGEVLVLLRGEAGISGAATGASLSSAAVMTACAENVAMAAGSKAAAVYTSLSAASGGKEVFALLKSDSKTTKEIIDELSANPDVIAVSPNYIKHSAVWPNDPRCSELWGMTAIKAPEAWDITTGSETEYIAVADSGIDATHPDLAANIDLDLSRNCIKDASDTSLTDNVGHGTHVSGTIAAVGNNGLGVAGVNWRTKLIVLKTMEKSGNGAIGRNSDFASAINYLIELIGQGKRISALNLSISGFEPGAPEKHTTNDVLWRAFKKLSDMNTTVIVVAAGNDKVEVGMPVQVDDDDPQYAYPASYVDISNMVVVGALDGSSAASYSNYSATLVDVAAPGSRILSTIPGGGYDIMYGTSMATPHVAGVIGLMASVAPGATASELKFVLLDNTDYKTNPIHGSGNKKLSCYGLIDAAAAVDAAVAELGESTPPSFDKYTVSTQLDTYNAPPVTSTVTIPIDWRDKERLPDGKWFYYWFIPSGASSAEFRYAAAASRGYGPYEAQLEDGAIEVDVSKHAAVKAGEYRILFYDATQEYVGTTDPMAIDPATNPDDGGYAPPSGGGSSSNSWWERWGCDSGVFSIATVAALALGCLLLAARRR
jgi:subtilisin family serine protease